MKNLLLSLAAILCALAGYAQEPDPNFYIYLCFGQSNMEGAGQIEEIDRKNVPERFQMMAAVNFSNPKRDMYNWYTAVPPLVRQGTGLCPVDWFGRTMVDNLPDNVRVGVIVVAIGGASIRHLDKDYDVSQLSKEEGWFQNFMAAYDKKPYDRLLACAKEAQKVGVIKGMLLHQGETDNGQSDWPKRVNKVYTDLLNDLNLKAEDVPIFVGETVRSEVGGACGLHNQSVLPTLYKTIPTSYIISAEGLDHKGDGLHFTSHSYRILGTRYAKKALELMGIKKPIINYSESGYYEPQAEPIAGDHVFDFSDFNPAIVGDGKYLSGFGIFQPGENGFGGWEFSPALDLSGYQYLVVQLTTAQTGSAQLRVWDTESIADKPYTRDFGSRKLLVSDLNGMMKNLDTGIVPVNTSHITRIGFSGAGGEKLRVQYIFATNNDPYNPAGVTDVAVDNDNTYTVYNMQGVLLLNHADGSAYESLPHGLYIVNGHKVLKH